MSKMTRLPGVADTDDVKPGMAFFAGTGPIGQTCGNCQWRGYWRPTRTSKFNLRTNRIEEKHYRTLACKKFLEFSMKHGPAVKPDWEACKYWEAKHER